MTVKEIVAKYLKENFYDGLFSDLGECGCCIEDLMPCGEGFEGCEAGVKVPCPPECGEHDWHIWKE